MKARKLAVCSAVVIVLLAAVIYLLSLRESSTPKQNSKKRYNVVMIVSDALRQDVLGCYGGEAVTPNIDWLARNGVLFENAYSTSPWTVPSSVSMFTGNYATTYRYSPIERTMKIFVPNSEFLLMEALHQCGYETPMRIENFHAALHNNLQGFSALANIGDVKGIKPKSTTEQIKQITKEKYFRSAEYKSLFIVLKRLLEMPPGKSFFLLHWILDPHAPYDPIEKFKSRIIVNTSKLSRRKRYYSDSKNFTEPLNSEEIRYMKALYTAEVEFVDERVGFILSVLGKKQLLDKTYIVFTSDHGEQFGEHGQFGHGGFGVGCNYYQVLMKVPLIISGPKLPKGKRVKACISHLDLMPTMKDLLGVRYKNNMQGESYKSLMLHEPKENKPLYFDDVREHDQMDALLMDDFKLIASKGEKFELFDLVHDSGEMKNVASSNSNLVDSLYAKIMEIRKENERRHEYNAAAVPDTSKALTDKEASELRDKLRALGYITD